MFFFVNFSKASSYCLPKKIFWLSGWLNDGLKTAMISSFFGEKKEKTLSFWETEHNVLTSLWIQQYIWFFFLVSKWWWFLWRNGHKLCCWWVKFFFWRMTIMKCRLIVFLTHLPNRSSSSRPWPSQTQQAYDHQTCSERTWTKYDHCAKI